MFRCRFQYPPTDPKDHTGVYQQTVVDAHNNLLAIIVWKTKVIAVPLDQISWIDWAD